ncbi:MAG: XdhC family protein [Phycisphaerales bacterium]
MDGDGRVLKAAADLLEAGEAFVLVTVVKTQGSTPRDAGARLLWRPGSDTELGELLGTVGGGQFEHLVLESARWCFEHKAHKMEQFVLGSDADQCCGGTMDVFLEYHGLSARLVVFGAGHVAKALCDLLAFAALEVIVADDRPEWNSAARFPGARRIMDWGEAVAVAQERGAETMACVMTCSHDTDLDLLRSLLVKPPVFVGLIGSRSKRACLFGRLVAAGIDEGVVARVHCPIGVGDTGKEPRAVAVSMAAQLLMEASTLACA